MIQAEFFHVLRISDATIGIPEGRNAQGQGDVDRPFENDGSVDQVRATNRDHLPRAFLILAHCEAIAVLQGKKK